MKLIILSLLLLAFSGLTAADEMQVGATGITFNAPAEFVELSDEIINIKWPHNRRPAWAVGNKNAGTTIAYDLKPHDISTAPLDTILEQFKGLFERIVPGIEWIETDVTTLDDKEWGFMEFTSNAVDTDIHNIMLFTSFEKKMLVFNFNSTKEEFEQYEDELRKAVESIDLP